MHDKIRGDFISHLLDRDVGLKDLVNTVIKYDSPRLDLISSLLIDRSLSENLIDTVIKYGEPTPFIGESMVVQ